MRSAPRSVRLPLLDPLGSLIQREDLAPTVAEQAPAGQAPPLENVGVNRVVHNEAIGARRLVEASDFRRGTPAAAAK
jgi:hypothetical protein